MINPIHNCLPLKWSSIVIVAALLLFVMLSRGEDALAIDAPHNRLDADNLLTCSSCHYSALSPPSWTTSATQTGDSTKWNMLCISCHVPGNLPHGAPYEDILTHSSRNTSTKYGEWSIECRVCHSPHYQQQVLSYGTDAASYLHRGTVHVLTTSAGATTSSITDNAADFTTDQWVGYLLVPNTAHATTMYRIKGNTDKILTVYGAINPYYASINKTYAVVYGKMVNQAIDTPGDGVRQVRFYNNAGVNSLGTSSDPGNMTSLCQVCHTHTTSFNNSGMLDGAGHPAGKAGTDCTECHAHSDGFKADCTKCHGVPPVAAAQNSDSVKNGMVNNEGGTGSSTPGAHGTHAVAYNYSCLACHTSGMPASIIYDKKIQIGFTIAGGSYQGGTYDGRSSLANGYSYSAGNAGTSVTQNGTQTCSAVYCHSNGTSVATGTVPALASPNWGTGTTSCDSCHGYPPNYTGGSPKPNSHGAHSYTCDNCHYATTTNGTVVTDPTFHANAVYDLQPGPGRSFSYFFAGPNGTCGTVSCHGDTGTRWGASACLNCHAVAQGGRAAIAPQFSANSHHVQGTALSGVHCYQCHWEANNDGSINPAYHGGSAVPGSAVDLVIYQAGTRPTTYAPVSTALQYTADGSRAQIANITPHCLGCHRDQNNDTRPFGDGKTPKQYAWDGTSVDARFSSLVTTTWGKYSGANITPKDKRAKAFSAHGNAIANQGGWDLNETWPDTRNGSINIACFDCHNSHGSSVAGITTRYTSSTTNGGILKDTTAGRGGYAMDYKPVSGGSTTEKNFRNAGASLCFDCHLTQAAGATPWGYGSTFGATAAVIGYWDSPNFAPGDVGAQKRYPYKAIMHNAGGHFGRSSDLHDPPDASHQVNGLCTACHDPHGVSPTLGVNQKYGVPMLKGTWVSSPYKEDVAPVTNWSQIAFSGFMGGYIGYHIDQNTFGNDIMGTAPNAIVEQDTQFAGLCLGCHPKSSLTAAATPSAPNAWKSKDRIHEAVNGWKTSSGTVKHNYTCSKCHSPHNGSVLPRLMTTNCLNSKHKGRTAHNPSPVISGSGSGSGDYGGGSGSGRIPGSYFGSGSGAECCSGPNPGSHLVSCHEGPNNSTDGTDQRWNDVTPWSATNLAPPTLVDEPSTGCNGTCATQLNWWPTINPDGDAVQYNLQVDDMPDFSSPNAASGWTSGTSWTVSLATLKTWYWRVQTRDAVHATIISGWSAADSFALAQITPPAAPVLIDETDSSCSGSCAVTLQWNAVAVPDGDPARYQVHISSAADFSSLYYATGNISGTSLPVVLPTGTTWYWKVMTVDSVHSVVTSGWSTADSFRMALPPTAPVLITQPNSVCASSCAKTLQWNASTGPFGDPLEYFVEIDDAQDFLTPVFNNSGNWTAGTNISTSALATNKMYYWRVRARDAVNPVFLSLWSSIGRFTLSTGDAPAQVTLAGPAEGFTDLSCDSYYYMTFQWNAALTAAEYNVQVSTDPAFSVVNYDSGWTLNTSSSIGLSTTASYYWRVQVRDPGSLSAGPPSLVRSFTITDTGACSPSCPMLYTWDSSIYAFETDVFSRGILGRPSGSTYVRSNPHDYYLLASAASEKNGLYELKYVEERYEIDYVDAVKLYAVDVPENRNVYAEANVTTSPAYYPPSQMLHSVNILERHPVSAVHINTGQDVSAVISQGDGNYLTLNEDREYPSWQTIEMDLGDLAGAPMIKLIINGVQAFPQTPEGYARVTAVKGLKVKLEVPDGAGGWTDRTAQVKIANLTEFFRPMLVNITSIFPGSDYRIRLSYFTKNLIDSVTFDTTQDLPLEIAELPFVSADLAFGGFNERQTVYDDIDTYLYGSKLDKPFVSLPGNYTRYGDVTPLLATTDDMFVIMGQGDELTFRFTPLDPVAAGKRRMLLLYGNGYYKAYRYEHTRTVEPLPFAAMSNFPYDPAVENYPADADHNQYRAEYNIRIH